MFQRSLFLLTCLLVPLAQARPAAAAPIAVPSDVAVAPVRTDVGDGVCVNAVHVQDPANFQIAFNNVDDALGLLNQTSTRLVRDGVVSNVFPFLNFANGDPVAGGDFDGDLSFPFSRNAGSTPQNNDRNLAVRVRGYLNINTAAPNFPRTLGLYADDGARMRIGNIPITVPDVDERRSARMLRQIDYGKSGLYPFEIVYYQNGSEAVLELSGTPLMNLDDQTPPSNLKLLGFRTLGASAPNLELYSARSGAVKMCQECSSDMTCAPGNYCAKDFGPLPPEGLCAPCNLPDHCGTSCMRCPTDRRICSAGSCVECAVDADCPSGKVCDPSTKSCRWKTCSETGDCPPEVRYAGGCSTSPTATAPANANGGTATSLTTRAGVAAALGALLVLLRRRRRARAGGLGLLLAGLLLPGTAQAQLSANSQTFHPAFGPENVITVEGTRTPKSPRPVLNLLFEYAHRPIYVYHAQSREILANTVSSLSTLHLMAGMGIVRWLSLGIDLPVVAYQGFDRRTPLTDVPQEPDPGGLGDLRVIAKARLINNERGGFGLAFVPQFTFPTGNGQQLRGDDAYGIEPRFALDYRTREGAFIALNVGFLGRTSNQVVHDMEVGSQVRYGLGGFVPLPLGFGLLGEVAGGTSVSRAAEGRIYSPLEGHVGARWIHGSGVNINVGGGMGFTEAVGSPQFRLFAGVGYLPMAKGPEPPPVGEVAVKKSGSGIGVVTSLQRGISCGTRCSAEYRLGAQVTLTADPSEGSRFLGWSGPCSGTQACVVRVEKQTEVGAAFALNEEKWFELLVEKEGDGTGVVHAAPEGLTCGKVCSMRYKQDQEVRLAATEDQGSRFAGWEGPCTGLEPCILVMKADTRIKARFIKQVIEVKEGELDLKGHVIHFETAKAVIDMDSFYLLDEVVVILKKHPDMRLRIEGHTDTVPFYKPGGNLQLSRDRAAAVVGYLVGKGIDNTRLTSEGYGETCPVDTNDNEAGRARNRRTEFLIQDPATGKYPKSSCKSVDVVSTHVPRPRKPRPKKPDAAQQDVKQQKQK